MVRLITSLVQLALLIPAACGIVWIVQDIRNGGLTDEN